MKQKLSSGEVLRTGGIAPLTEAQNTSWWLWWNLLSLDAPTVAVMWAVLFASARGVGLRFSDGILLALCVWVIYVTDRLLDGWTGRRERAMRARHFFCMRHRLELACMALLAIAVILWMAAQQSEGLEVVSGMKLGAIVSVYLAAVHARSGWAERIFPKELAVGVLFAAGTTLPVWALRGIQSADMLGSLVLFSALCTLNCVAIECWERDWKDETSPSRTHALVYWCDGRVKHLAAALAAIALTFTLILRADGLHRPEVLTVVFASLLLLAVDMNRERLSTSSLRVLADAALAVSAIVALACMRWRM